MTYFYIYFNQFSNILECYEETTVRRPAAATHTHSLTHKQLFTVATQGPKGDLWVQSPLITIGNIRSIAENRRRSTEAYRRVMSTWPSMMVGTAEGDLPKLFSPALLA